MKKYDLMSGHLGNGITVWNRSVEIRGDYQRIAHIDANREVTWFIKKPIPDEVRIYVKSIVEGENPSISASQPDQKVFVDDPDVLRNKLKGLEEKIRSILRDENSDLPNKSREERIFDIAFNAVHSKEFEGLTEETRLRALQDYLILKTSFFKTKGL